MSVTAIHQLLFSINYHDGGKCFQVWNYICPPLADTYTHARTDTRSPTHSLAADNAEHMDPNKSGVEALFKSVLESADKHASYTLKLPAGDTSIHLAFKLLHVLPKLVQVPR